MTDFNKRPFDTQSMLEAESLVKASDSALARVAEEARAAQSRLREVWLAVSRQLKLTRYDPDLVNEFLSKPYLVRSVGDGKFELSVPRFIGLQAGWPLRHEGAYSVYLVSRFTQMLAPAPDWLAHEMGLERSPFLAKLTGNTLTLESGDPSAFAAKYGGQVKRNGESIIFSVKPATRFDLLRRIIREEGFIPYTPAPVSSRLQRQPLKYIAHDEDGNLSFALRPHQARDYARFLETGAVSVFAYPQTGKSFLVLQAGAQLAGPKLILCPRRTLVEQWRNRLALYLTPEAAGEFVVSTYQGAAKHSKREWSLVVFDEAHHLPANFAIETAANIQTQTRMALSATPFREDGASEIIPALGGFPVGVDWPVSEAQRPRVTVWVVEREVDKFPLMRRLCEEPVKGKTLVFTFRLDIGRKAARLLDVPFIEGRTKTPLEILESNDTVVISSVGNEGLSFPVKRVVEIDFLFGSRAEAGQRLGRLAYETGDKQAGEHHVLMTRTEFAAYHKRLLAYEQWGLDIDVRGAGADSEPRPRPTPTLRRTARPIQRRGPNPTPVVLERATLSSPSESQDAMRVPAIAAKVQTASRSVGQRTAPYVLRLMHLLWSAPLSVAEVVEAQGITDAATKSRYQSAAKSLTKTGLLTRDEQGRYQVSRSEIDRLLALDSIRSKTLRS